jgi:protein-S-isoprenylcysteine O-methyltransferase Ste14
MKRYFYFAYGVVCHLMFLGLFAYMMGFVGNLVVPKSLDSGTGGSLGSSLAIDMLLLAIFALQHSVMARPGFKRVWTRLVPEPIERSTYVLASCAAVAVLMWQWRSINIVVWDVPNGGLRAALWCVFVAGWLLVPGVTLLINHFDLFGTRQVWLHLNTVHVPAVPRAVGLQSNAPPVVRWLGNSLLGHAYHDCRTLVVCRGYDGLHGCRRSIRGT